MIMNEFKHLNFLVTGGSGFLGGALARALLTIGAKVICTYFNTNPKFSHPKLQWIRCDLQDEEKCKKLLIGMDVVLHCAAVTSGAADIVGTPLMHLTPNVILNTRLLESSYRAGVKKFLFLSSAAAYEPRGDYPLKEDDMSQGDPADVYFPAGWMKRYAEILCKTYALKLSPSMSTVVIRPSNIYGPGDKFDWQKSHVTAAIIRRVIERQDPIILWGDGSACRDILFIDDFVDGVLRALQAGGQYGVYNIAKGQTYSVKEIINIALKAANYSNVEVQYDTSKPQTVDKITLDITKARNELNFVPKTELIDGIRQTIKWYENCYSNEKGVLKYE